MKTIKNYTGSDAVIIFLFVLFFYCPQLISQSCYNPFVDSVISKVSLQSLSGFNRQLSGDTSALIGGIPYTIISRYWTHPGNQKAAQYIYEKFQSFGLAVKYDTFSTTGINVIAKKTGVKYPNQQIIVCAHFDDGPLIVQTSDTIPGADDNASGVSAVLETARIFKDYPIDYTMVFAAWDEEEAPIILSGSRSYADSAFAHGDSIISVLNLDMIAWDGNNDFLVRIGSNLNSIFYANILESSIRIYAPSLAILKFAGGWDESSFWNRGYKAIVFTEDNNMLNPNYHRITDRFSTLILPYFLKTTQMAAAFLFVEQRDYIIEFTHSPLLSSSDTAARTVSAVIRSNHKISGPNNPNIPRLYYKTGIGSFNWCNAFYTNLDTFKFLIPGQPLGSTVFYYFAAQDSLGTMVGSLPAGARGFSPPGTIPPPYPFSYRILKQLNICSNTLPKGLLPKSIVFDTIKIQQQGSIHDYNLNLTIYHTNDSDLYIWLTRPGTPMLQLSTVNGGSGDNYINTTFDDEASTPITQGTPPFTGSFKPEQPLSMYDNHSLQGDWILRVFNNSSTVTGQLVNWCLSFDYFNPIGITNNQMPVTSSLSQNYPNPFNASTRISFTLGKKAHVKLIVYDMLGRETAIVTEGYYVPGSYNANFNGNSLASGLYFYTMHLDGNLFQARKMVLIK